MAGNGFQCARSDLLIMRSRTARVARPGWTLWPELMRGTYLYRLDDVSHLNNRRRATCAGYYPDANLLVVLGREASTSSPALPLEAANLRGTIEYVNADRLSASRLLGCTNNNLRYWYGEA